MAQQTNNTNRSQTAHKPLTNRSQTGPTTVQTHDDADHLPPDDLLHQRPHEPPSGQGVPS